MLRTAVLKLKQRVLGLLVRGVVTLANDGEPPDEDEEADDPKPVQLLQVRMLQGETRDLVQRIQQYGLTSVPMPGAYPVLLVCPGGERSQALAICVDDVRHRPRGGAPGDVVVYDWQGNTIRLHPGDPPEEEDDPPPNALLEIVAVKDMTINVVGDATISVTGTLNLGGAGGARVARLGDSVQVGASTGTITGGSTKVKAT